MTFINVQRLLILCNLLSNSLWCCIEWDDLFGNVSIILSVPLISQQRNVQYILYVAQGRSLKILFFRNMLRIILLMSSNIWPTDLFATENIHY